MSDLETTSGSSDGFGLMPVCYQPGPLKKLFGHTSFRLDAEGIAVGAGSSPREIAWANVASVGNEAGKVFLHLRTGSPVVLKCGAGAGRVAALAARLLGEYDEFHLVYDQPGPLSVANGMAIFSRCLNFRGLPYVRAVDVLLKTAADNNFTDVHLEPVSSGQVKVTFRLAGEVRPALELSHADHARVTARLKHLAGCLSHVTDTAQEGAFRQGSFSVRISTFPASGGERVSLRIITALRFARVADLGWNPDIAATWLSQIRSGRGLYIISGPVGSGKTTAMYATLSELSAGDNGLRLVTVEDPVEAVIPGICQSSLDQLREKDLAAAFKHLLRQDPNVIALGEIRDLKCIKEALQAGLSGHLVMATFHAGSIDEALDRIRQMGGDDQLVLSGLKGVLHLDLQCQQGKIMPKVDFASFDGHELRKCL
ncbi:MAG TPA: ATPase, T2SS/T4P/T4SS family [Candidatus Rifleibacterium sp.]|nr:ATPase, T2SS/T4P/T4SS family [Candidatus Rifleibacterium sp.]HPT46333.1 ATPase, T2SS/T4P/T4SS family [Candidatus Rifleibacterium sp.]